MVVRRLLMLFAKAAVTSFGASAGDALGREINRRLRARHEREVRATRKPKSTRNKKNRKRRTR